MDVEYIFGEREMLNEEKYYELMDSFSIDLGFEEICYRWFLCFEYILIKFNCGHNSKTIKSLFYDFDMANWSALHRENTEYKDHTKEQLIVDFCQECSYICDRVSYDRLFRTHWLFRQAYHKELFEVQYGEK